MSKQLEQAPRTLPYGRQWIDEADIEAVAEVLRSDFLTTGPVVQKLETEIKNYCGAKHCAVMNSGTSALHAMYFAAGFGAGDHLVTSPLTFAATGNAALYLGGSVSFVDIDPATGNIDPNLIEDAIRPETKLVCPIDFTGHPADYNEINSVAAKHGLKVVADAAHSFGGSYHGKLVGTLADATEISMHPVKPFTTGEGGAVLTDDDTIAERAARFRTHGITRDRSRMSHPDEGEWYYEQIDLGFNYRLTDIQCALGISQMVRLGAFVRRRQEIAAHYSRAFADLKELILPTVREGVEPAWHLYILRVADKGRRRAFFERLRQLGILAQVHYVPVYWHPYYESLGYKRGLCPLAEDYYERAISIPIYPKMTDDDVEYSAAMIRQAVGETL